MSGVLTIGSSTRLDVEGYIRPTTDTAHIGANNKPFSAIYTKTVDADYCAVNVNYFNTTFATADATISSNYYNTIYYRTIQKFGNVKILHLALSTNSWTAVNTWTNIGTVPSGYYPKRLVETGVVTSGMKYVNLHIDMSGNVAVCPRQATISGDLFCTILPYI